MTHLPVFVDPPSHAGVWIGWWNRWRWPRWRLGADGLLIEVHNDPAKALSDGKQSLTPAQFERLSAKLQAVAAAVGRSV